MGTEIEKQQTKKQIRQLCILAVRRKKRKKNKKKNRSPVAIQPL
jgi:hypothetical protein